MNPALRIASLVPSVTELLVALGLGPCLVARTGFCVHPAAALAAVPKVGGTKDVRLDALQRLAPSHVVVNVDENRLETLDALRAWGIQVVVTHPCSPQDVRLLIAQLVDAFAGPHGAARYPVVVGSEPWLTEVEQVLLSSEPYAFTRTHVSQAQALCPRARVRLVDGEALSWYGVRTAPGLRYLRQLLG